MARAWLGLLTCLLLPACTGMIFQPMRQHVATPASLGFEFQDLRIRSGDAVDLHAWFVPAVGIARGSILVLHGNAENISTHMRSVLWLAREGFNLLLLDYRGYGESAGVATLGGVHLDALAGIDALAGKTPRLPLFVLGQSLGASVAISGVAALQPPTGLRGLILDSAFTGYRDIAREKLAAFWLTWPLQYPLSWTFANEPRPLDDIRRLPPLELLIIGVSNDPVVPLQHALDLFAAAPAPKTLWQIAGSHHIGAFSDAGVRRRLLDWLRSASADEALGDHETELLIVPERPTEPSP